MEYSAVCVLLSMTANFLIQKTLMPSIEMNVKVEWLIELGGLRPDQPSQNFLLFILAPSYAAHISITQELCSKNRPECSCCAAVNRAWAFWSWRGGRSVDCHININTSMSLQRQNLYHHTTDMKNCLFLSILLLPSPPPSHHYWSSKVVPQQQRCLYTQSDIAAKLFLCSLWGDLL